MRPFWRRRRVPAKLAEPPEFGVRVVLQRGDKIVKRDDRGVCQVIRVTAERAEAVEVLRITRPPQ